MKNPPVKTPGDLLCYEIVFEMIVRSAGILAVLDESVVNPALLAAVGSPDVVAALLAGVNAEYGSSVDTSDLVLILVGRMVAKCKIVLLYCALNGFPTTASLSDTTVYLVEFLFCEGSHLQFKIHVHFFHCGSPFIESIEVSSSLLNYLL